MLDYFELDPGRFEYCSNIPPFLYPVERGSSPFRAVKFDSLLKTLDLNFLQ